MKRWVKLPSEQVRILFTIVIYYTSFIQPTYTNVGFLLGDGAGLGKGRTLAGYVVENISRGVKKHVWISISSDLYEGE